jgi:hypothetical protein
MNRGIARTSSGLKKFWQILKTYVKYVDKSTYFT